MNLIYFTIREGEIVQKGRIKKAMALPDGEYEMEIKKKNRRSIQANRYYFGICVKLIQETLIDFGNDVSMDEVHEWLKAKFNYKEIINEITGEIERVPRSTADLNKEDFRSYLERIQRFAAMELNLVIPDPNTQLQLDY